MLLIIVSGVYAAVITMLIICIIKNGIKLKNNADTPETRQYFYTALILLIIIALSFAALLLRANNGVFLSDSGSTSTAGVLAVKNSYTLLKWLFGIILAIILIGLFDWFVLRRTAKTPQQYRTRRLLVFGTSILVLVFWRFMQ